MDCRLRGGIGSRHGYGGFMRGKRKRLRNKQMRRYQGEE
jgi:hypothetical protein